MTNQHFWLKAILLSSVTAISLAAFTRHDMRHTSETAIARELFTSQIYLADRPLTVPVELVPAATPTEQIVNHIVRSGETLTSLWEKYGASARHSFQVMQDLRDQGLVKLGLKRGESVVLRISPDGELLNFEKQLDDGRTLLVKRSSDENFETEIVPAEFEEIERVVSGTINDSLAATAQSFKLSYNLVDDIVDLFSSRIRFTKDIQPGDSFAVTYLERKCKRTGASVGPAIVKEASFTVGGKLMAMFGEMDAVGKMQYLDESGVTPGDFFLRYPVNFTRISSTFTFARFHPVLQKNRPHLGVDFAAPRGTPVRSVGDGEIVEFGFKREPGNWVKIKHSDRYSTAYMHLHSLAPGLKKGSRVSRGQLIGTVGSTGLSTGPHLHFSLYDKAKYVDPLTTELPRMENQGVSIPKAVMARRLQNIRALHDKTKVLALSSANVRQVS